MKFMESVAVCFGRSGSHRTYTYMAIYVNAFWITGQFTRFGRMDTKQFNLCQPAYIEADKPDYNEYGYEPLDAWKERYISGNLR